MKKILVKLFIIIFLPVVLVGALFKEMFGALQFVKNSWLREISSAKRMWNADDMETARKLSQYDNMQNNKNPNFTAKAALMHFIAKTFSISLSSSKVNKITDELYEMLLDENWIPPIR